VFLKELRVFGNHVELVVEVIERTADSLTVKYSRKV